MRTSHILPLACARHGLVLVAELTAHRRVETSRGYTGLGPADHVRPEGFVVPQSPPYRLLDGVTVQVGDGAIAAENAWAVAGRMSIDAVQFRLSDGALSGTNASLRVTITGQDSNTVLLPVQ